MNFVHPLEEKAFTHIKSSKISCEKIMRARQFTTNQ